MNETYVYSLSFVIKSKDLDISKIFPDELKLINMNIGRLNHPVSTNPFNKHKQIRNKNKHLDNHPLIKSNDEWKNSIKLIPIDIKHINLILNKLTEENYDKMLKETKTFNYSDPKIVSILFKKVLREPFFSGIYSKLCKDLPNIHLLLSSLYLKEFDENRHKNLAVFIGELYKVGLINNISEFIRILESDLDEKNLEILCTLIKTIGINNKIFKKVLRDLNYKKDTFSSRFRFMIMDIIDLVRIK
jgi:hypothetical protein